MGLVLAALAARSGGAEAQQRVPPVLIPDAFTVIPRNDLAFGTLVRGFATTVAPADLHRAAVFELRGPANLPVRVEIVLPPVMETAAGDRLVLSFGPADGLLDYRGTGFPAAGLVFNPLNPLIASLGPGGTVQLRIGGTARPERLQPGGTYRGAIYLTMYNLAS